MPLVEDMLKGLAWKGSKPIKGRLDGSIPRDGELNPNKVTQALGLPDTMGQPIPEVVSPRPPALCVGCPHADSFLALSEALKEYGRGHVFSDIGCYTLGFMPPYNAINSCVDMSQHHHGKGASDADVYPPSP